jgi:hypothetical protein
VFYAAVLARMRIFVSVVLIAALSGPVLAGEIPICGAGNRIARPQDQGICKPPSSIKRIFPHKNQRYRRFPASCVRRLHVF